MTSIKIENTAHSSVLVLLAAYNGGQFIQTQIDSIIKQKDVSVHIYVRDDGSIDNTIAILNAMQSLYPSHITVLQDTFGPTGSAAENFFALLRNADVHQYDYVAFADQDDLWLPEKLQRAVECISGCGGGGYSSNLLAWNENDNTAWMMNKCGNSKSFDYLFQGASAGCTYVLDQSCAALIKTRLEQLKRPYCDGISHDWTIYAICRSAGINWFRDNKSFIRYRQHDNNVYGAHRGLLGIRARIKMIKKGWYKNHILWLENVIDNHPEERAIIDSLKQGHYVNRLRLIWRASQFRRLQSEVWKLRLIIALGLIG